MRPISNRALRQNISTKKSQTGNFWASAWFESTEESVTLSDAAPRLAIKLKNNSNNQIKEKFRSIYFYIWALSR